jgi:hypothetical protein
MTTPSSRRVAKDLPAWDAAMKDTPVEHYIAVRTLETYYRYPRVLATAT